MDAFVHVKSIKISSVPIAFFIVSSTGVKRNVSLCMACLYVVHPSSICHLLASHNFNVFLTISQIEVKLYVRQQGPMEIQNCYYVPFQYPRIRWPAWWLLIKAALHTNTTTIRVQNTIHVR